MNNWHPKPLRPQDPSPLFQKDEGFTIKKSADLSPIQQQRLQDGTHHTRGSQYRVSVGQLPQAGGPTLYLDDVEKSVKEGASVDPDAVVKGFLSKGDVQVSPHDEDEETEKAESASIGEKLGAAAGKTVQTAGKVAGKVVGTAVGLSQQR